MQLAEKALRIAELEEQLKRKATDTPARLVRGALQSLANKPAVVAVFQLLWFEGTCTAGSAYQACLSQSAG